MPTLDWLNRDDHRGGRCVFCMLFKVNSGLSITQQIEAAIHKG